ncbi:MAG: hypothetical protein JXP73_02620 [Deltaproteobacteria bacterium]|nr:hypothetical protein [Deltaproteobacteria bacterium]
MSRFSWGWAGLFGPRKAETASTALVCAVVDSALEESAGASACIFVAEDSAGNFTFSISLHIARHPDFPVRRV